MTWINPGASTFTHMAGMDRHPQSMLPEGTQLMVPFADKDQYVASWATHPTMRAYQVQSGQAPVVNAPVVVVPGYDPTADMMGGLMMGAAAGGMLNMAMWGGMMGFGLMSPLMWGMGLGYGWPLLWW